MPERIGHYKIVSTLGRGGMGVVYKAHEESLNRFVAIKVLGEHLVEDEVFRSRFVREAQSAASLSHPNIVQIFYIGEDEGTNYFVMEYVEGKPVDVLIKEQGQIEPKLAARIILDAANGLAAAHDKGVIHRDIKPANLMLNRRGNVKIADFGLALPSQTDSKLTATGMLMGTPGYLAPEQCRGEKADHRTDIYALGVSLFEMLTGTSPFKSESPILLIRQILDEQPPEVSALNPAVDQKLKAILSKMLEKDLDKRYQTAHELVDDLEQYLEGESPRTIQRSLAALAGTAASGLPPSSNDVATAVTIESADKTAMTMNELGVKTEIVPPVPGGAVPSPPPPPYAAQTSIQPSTASTAPNIETRSKRSPFLLIASIIALILVAGGVGAWMLTRSSNDDPASQVDLASSDSVTSVPREFGDSGLGEIAPVKQSSSTDGFGADVDRDEQTSEPSKASTPSRTGEKSAATSRATPVQKSAPSKEASPRTSTASKKPVREEAKPASRQLDGTAIAVYGDSQLAPTVSSMLAERLRNTGATVVDANFVASMKRLLGEDAASDDLMNAARDQGLRYVLLIRIDPTGERELQYMGRSQTAYSSQVSAQLFDVETRRPLDASGSESVEYTTLSREREAQKIVRRLTLAIAKHLKK